MSTIEIKRFTPGDKRLFETFLRLPKKLYRADRFWVPEWLPERRHFHNPRHNPELRHMDVRYFLAYRDGEPTGRITAHKNHRHNEYHRDRVGFFGFFECEDDQGAASALFDAAAEQLADWGCDTLRGPASFSSNGEWGMLFDGRFEDPSYPMMTYCPRYYARLCERANFDKAMDLHAFAVFNWQWPNAFVHDLAEAARAAHRITLRPIRVDRRHWATEMQILRQLYNAAWEGSWGFVPLDDAEFFHLADSLEHIIHPKLCFIAEADGKPIGVSLTIPDVHQILVHTRARTLPLLYHFFLRKTQFRFGGIVHRVRMAMLSVLPEYRDKHVHALLAEETFQNAVANDLLTAEMSYVLETNEELHTAAAEMGAKVYKIYRLWDRPIAAPDPAAKAMADAKARLADTDDL